MRSISVAEAVVPPWSPARHGVVVCGLVAVACVGTLLLVATPFGALTSLFTHFTFALPGIVLVHSAFGRTGGWLPTAAFGPLLGIALSSVAVLGLWTVGARGSWILMAGPALACSLAAFAPRMKGRWTSLTLQTSDLVCLGLLLVIVPALVARPFSLVGAMLPEGEVYRAYFTADYVWRRAVVAELAKGDFLPANPFYLHDVLRYYWLPHLMIAVQYRWLREVVHINELLLAHSVLIDVAFVTFLYGMGRLFVAGPVAVAAGVGCSVLFSSFEGLYGLWDHWRVGASFSLLRHFNIDAISRWLLQAMPIDGLQRLLWYQPHHALGYAIGLLGLLAIARRVRRYDPWVFAIGGTLLAMSTLISSFGGLMLTAAAALHEGVSVVRAREWKRAAVHVLAAAVPLFIGASLVTLLQYVDHVDTPDRIIHLGLNTVAIRNVIPGTLLSFGPAILLAGPALWIAWRRRRDEFGAFFALLAVCVVFYFFVDVRDHQDVYVGWRVGHLTFIACGALLATTFERAATLRTAARRLAWGAITLVVLASAPTLVLDAYNTQDVGNDAMGAGFRLTLVLTRDELDAFEWIRTHTRPNAVFQVDPVARDPDTWAYLPAFAERRMSAGLPISMVPLEKYTYETKRIRRIFDDGIEDAHDRARRSGVQFVLIGPPERAAHAGVEARYDTMPGLFPLVFRNDTISIYRVSGT